MKFPNPIAVSKTKTSIAALAIAAYLSGSAPAVWANNAPIAGSGCITPNNSTQLGAVEDQLTGRNVVSIGVDRSTPFLQHLQGVGPASTIGAFLNPGSLTASQVGSTYVLLVGAHHICPKEFGEIAAIARAKANGVPIVLEGFEKDELKTLTGIGLKSDAAVVQFAPGGRGQTITLVHQPTKGHTAESAADAVNRAIGKHKVALLGTNFDSGRQAYAENVWDVWLQNTNFSCTLPYYGPEDVNFPQTGNLDFGVQISLIAQKQPFEKAVDIQYIGAGFTPLAPGNETIDYNKYFKGALTLETNYAGSLYAPYEAALNGTANTVQPQPTIGAHQVTKTNGFTYNVGTKCSGGLLGPGCTVSADFSYTNATSDTHLIAERAINAQADFGQVPDPDGSLCGDVAHGCWKADHDIQYYLSSTAVSDGGYAIDLTKNDWYGFYDPNDGAGITHRSYGDALNEPCDGFFVPCDAQGAYRAARSNVRDWPDWSFSDALTEGEAGYTFNGAFTGDLNLLAKVSGEEGIFTLGNGPKQARNYDEFVPGAPCDACNDYYYRLNLYTDAVNAAANIAIDANQVNYSGMPTCSMANFSQQDLGIYSIYNQTNYALDLSKMNALPYSSTPLPTFPNYFNGTLDYLIGVSATSIEPGQTGYVALCSSNQTPTTSMYLSFANQAVNGKVEFSGAGALTNNPNDPHVSLNAVDRVITIH